MTKKKIFVTIIILSITILLSAILVLDELHNDATVGDGESINTELPGHEIERDANLPDINDMDRVTEIEEDDVTAVPYGGKGNSMDYAGVVGRDWKDGYERTGKTTEDIAVEKMQATHKDIMYDPDVTWEYGDFPTAIEDEYFTDPILLDVICNLLTQYCDRYDYDKQSVTIASDQQFINDARYFRTFNVDGHTINIVYALTIDQGVYGYVEEVE